MKKCIIIDTDQIFRKKDFEMEIKIELTKTPKAKPTDETKLGFGHIFTDHMFVMNYDTGKGWHDARIVPFDKLFFRICRISIRFDSIRKV